MRIQNDTGGRYLISFCVFNHFLSGFVFSVYFVLDKREPVYSGLLPSHVMSHTEPRTTSTPAVTLPPAGRFSPLFKDVYREVGILEVLVQCLSRYADLLKSRRQTQQDGDGESATVDGSRGSGEGRSINGRTPLWL